MSIVNTMQKTEMAAKLGDQRVFLVLQDLSNRAIRWTGGGSINHRIIGMGYLAESGTRAIDDGRMGINRNHTFDDLKRIDPKGYEQTIEFIYPLVQIGVYHP